ncbi:MAG: DUF881 domain-containing protein [Chloroflexota bacterium]|jgi:uncharacterized protein YlxW (UPF0749 family)
MADRAASTHIPRTPPPDAGLAVEKVRDSLRKPFDIPSRYRWLTIAALILGLFISMEWQAPVAKAPVTSDYPRELSKDTIKRLESEQKGLKQIIADMRNELAELQKDATGRKSALAGLNAELEAQRVLAGMVPLVGPGLQVTLDDSSVKSIPSGEEAGRFIIHDYDIRDIVSLLWQGGAEAIAIGDERIVNSTSIYCVGSTILVNDTRMSPPYVITAIGPPEMEEILNSPARLQRLKMNVRQYGVQFNVAQSKDLYVPAFSGRFSSRYAQPGDVD